MPILANTAEVSTVGPNSAGGVTIQHVASTTGSTLYATIGIGN